MNPNRQYRIYRHEFVTPLQTAHGFWGERVSIILREEDKKGRISFGELCPTPGFLDIPINELVPIVQRWVLGQTFEVNPLMQSAISCMASEIWDSTFGENDSSSFFSAELITLNSDFGNPSAVYKKKIGLSTTSSEIQEVQDLLNLVPINSMIRLDANESLKADQIFQWNEAFANESRLQFIEQPFPKENINELLKIEQELSISLALDESLVWKNDLSFFDENDWQGFYVLKPFLFQDWEKTLRFICAKPERTIVSTVFESPFGYEAVCRCASFSNQIAGLDRNLFQLSDKEFSQHHQQPLSSETISITFLDELWGNL